MTAPTIVFRPEKKKEEKKVVNHQPTIENEDSEPKK
jgi:hypothetical protein